MGVETVRYYQRVGLLEAPQRRSPGARRYTPRHLAQLRFVRRCRGLGLSIKEIGELGRLRKRGAATCATIHQRFEEIADALRTEKRALEARQGVVKRALAMCPGDREASMCGVLQTLEKDDE